MSECFCGDIFACIWENTYFRFLIGIAISSFPGSLFINKCMEWGHAYIKSEYKEPRRKRSNIGFAPQIALWLGIVERILYIFALLMGAWSWIAVWLGVKIGANWKKWTQGSNRAGLDLFLLGSGLSILVAILCAWLIAGKFPVSLKAP